MVQVFRSIRCRVFILSLSPSSASLSPSWDSPGEHLKQLQPMTNRPAGAREACILWSVPPPELRLSLFDIPGFLLISWIFCFFTLAAFSSFFPPSPLEFPALFVYLFLLFSSGFKLLWSFYELLFVDSSTGLFSSLSASGRTAPPHSFSPWPPQTRIPFPTLNLQV